MASTNPGSTGTTTTNLAGSHFTPASQGGFGKPNMEFNGVPVFFSTVGDLKNGAAFTLPGIGIFINPNARNDNDLLRHEFGHWLIALKEGNEAFYSIDVPLSLLSAKFSEDHQSSWTEVRANDLSYQYFGKPADWNFKDYHVSDDVRYSTPNFFQNTWNQFIEGINQYNNIYKWVPHQ